MMGLNLNQAQVKALFTGLQSHAESLNLFDAVATHPPQSAPPKRWCAIWMSDLRPAQKASGLAATAGRVEFTVVAGSTAQMRPLDQLDPDVMYAGLSLMGEYSGNFTLGGTVMEVDLLGAHGTPLSGRAAWVSIDGSRYRVWEITMPLVIDNLWSQAP